MISPSEAERIRLCRSTSPQMTVRELCHYYMINPDHATNVLGENPRVVSSLGPTRKRRIDKHKVGEAFALDNVYEHITAQQLADSIGISLPTAYKIIQDRPDFYRPIKRGVWECRNAHEDRKADKGKQ